ncbi:unnamed protein product [Mucor hiemalis]
MSESSNNMNHESDNANPQNDVAIVSEQESIMPVIDNNEVRAQQFTAGFNNHLGAGKEFVSLIALRELAVEYEKEQYVVIVTSNSLFKEDKMTLKCKHGGAYRAAKKAEDPSSVPTVAVHRATSTSRSDCPMNIVARKQKNGLYVIKSSSGEHNRFCHESVPEIVHE